MERRSPVLRGVHSRFTLGPLWVHSGSTLGPLWVHSGSTLGPLWVHSGFASRMLSHFSGQPGAESQPPMLQQSPRRARCALHSRSLSVERDWARLQCSCGVASFLLHLPTALNKTREEFLVMKSTFIDMELLTRHFQIGPSSYWQSGAVRCSQVQTDAVV